MSIDRFIFVDRKKTYHTIISYEMIEQLKRDGLRRELSRRVCSQDPRASAVLEFREAAQVSRFTLATTLPGVGHRRHGDAQDLAALAAGMTDG